MNERATPSPTANRARSAGWLVRTVADRAKRISRVMAYFSLVSLALGLFAAHRAWGDVEQMTLALGDELGKLGGSDGAHTIRLNGQPLRIATSTEDAPLERVLDAFEGYCRARTGGLVDTLAAMPEQARASIGDAEARLVSGVMRKVEGDRGAVACLVRPDGQGEGSVTDLLERVGRLAETGDLASLGRLRYLHAKRTRTGKTHVVLAWTDGAFEVGAMFPSEGDAPGSDPLVGPRPPAASRFFSAAVDGVPYGVRLYESAEPPDAMMGRYEEAILARGYRLVAHDPNDRNARAYAHPEGDLWVTVAPLEASRGASSPGAGSSEGSLVSVLEIVARRP